jgi:BirA family biotin operon repressor/biotin-[acetyl-CoA-carboxylase] ligase
MDEARALAVAGQVGPIWIVARSQSGGRGRHGRGWSSPPGNLHASLLLTDPCTPMRAPELGFVAGLALHDAVTRCTGLHSPDVALKWPNDLLVKGAKTAGLLLEGQSMGQVFHVTIGMGVNVAVAPADTPYAAGTLAAIAPTLTADILLTAIRATWSETFAIWQELGFAPIREAWRRRAAGRGEGVTVRLPSGALSGLFEDIDPSGRLILLTSAGRRVIDAGDLYFGDGLKA